MLSLERLRVLLGGIRPSATRFVFVSACHSEPAALEFARHVPHVIGVRLAIKVLDDAAALFARHVYLGLVSGATVRQAFDGAGGRRRQRAVARPAGAGRGGAQVYLLPEWKDGDDGPDPHDKIPFPALLAARCRSATRYRSTSCPTSSSPSSAAPSSSSVWS